MKARPLALLLILAASIALPSCGDDSGCDEGDTLTCECGMGFVGEQVCGEDATFGECECDACAVFAVTVCSCEGVDAFYEQLGTTCLESYANVIDSGIGTLCNAALEAWEMLGGCEQFGALGDDDDTA